MSENNASQQESPQQGSDDMDYAKEFEAVQAVISAKLAENAKEEDASQLTKAELEAIRF